MRACSTRALRNTLKSTSRMSGQAGDSSKMTYETSDYKGKGKAKEVESALAGVQSGKRAPSPLRSMLEEALNTPITHTSRPSIDQSYYPSTQQTDHVLSSPPLAHHPAAFPRIQRPQLVSQLTRSTLPVSSLSYATASDSLVSPRQPLFSYQPDVEALESPRKRTTSSSSHASSSTARQSFPDLDPATGLPLSTAMRRSSSTGGDSTTSLHLQRTITSLLASPQKETKPTAMSSYLPSLPALPNLSGLSLGIPGRSSSESGRPRTEKRQLSSSLPTRKDDDSWGSSLGSWWNGSGAGTKGNEGMMADEDVQGSTEETQAKIQEKCKSGSGRC
jgi:triacylglycerol lipase